MITVERLSYGYTRNDLKPVQVLQEVTLAIREGEFIGIIGANGSGKTTLARCLNGLLLPDSGQVIVDGMSTRNPADLLAIRRIVGMVFQNPDNQIVAATVEREIAFGLENLGTPYDQLHALVDDMLQQFDLIRYRYHPPHNLSGGEKQRLALAAVMAMQPKYLILDEPTSLLDPQSRKDMLTTIQQLHKQQRTGSGIGILLITQYPEELLNCDVLLVMDRGKIICHGTPADIFNQVDFLKSLGLEPPIEYEIEQLMKPFSR